MFRLQKQEIKNKQLIDNQNGMKVVDLVKLINGQVVCGEQALDTEVDFAFASDLMSDVLTVKKENLLLITGLANIQAVRTAEMSDIEVVVFVRNKAITTEMVELAKENGIILIGCSSTLYRVSGILYQNGLKPVY